MDKIIISNMYRQKNKQSFFALHQIFNKIKNIDSHCDIEFHILWDDDTDTEWSEKINDLFTVTGYNKQFFVDYVCKAYDFDYFNIKEKFSIYPAIYFVIMAHYLRRVRLFDYYLIYDDDILINYDFKDVVDAMINKIPVLITEPFNQSCDKVLISKLINAYGQEALDIYRQRNPKSYGFNAGFQGIDLRIYDDFLSKDRFDFLISLFSFESIYDKDGKEIWGNKRFVIDTQQQSFFSTMNILRSKNHPYILDPETTYVAPNFGGCSQFGELNPEDELSGWGCCLKSKISHFIGHTQGKGKPKQFIDRMDEYLKERGFI